MTKGLASLRRGGGLYLLAVLRARRRHAGRALLAALPEPAHQ